MTAAGYALGGPTYNHGSDDAAARYGAAIGSAAAILGGDGLNITHCRTAYDPTSDVGSDLIHPSATGHDVLRDDFVPFMVKTAYPVDHVTAPRIAQATVRAGMTVASQLVNSGTPAALTGASKTIVAPFDGIAVVHGDFDVEQITAGIFIGDLAVNGSVLATSGRVGFDPKAANARAAQSHTWSFPIVAGYPYVIELYASCGSGSFTVYGSLSGNSNTGFTPTLLPAA